MKNKQSGVAIVEFALVLPLLLILTFITTEFGRALYQYNILTKSVRDAARYLSTQPSWKSGDPDTNVISVVSGTSITIGDVKQTAKNLVVFGKPNPILPDPNNPNPIPPVDNPLVIGLTTPEGAIDPARVPNPVWQLAGASPVINTVTVTITGYTFKPLIASAFGVNFGNITYADISATMRGAL